MLNLVVKKAISVVSLVIFISALNTKITSADGMIIPPKTNQQIYETGQKAVIWYENGVETLILSTTFRGRVDEFVWVIPTPEKPEVGKSKDELFTALNEYTKPPRPTYDRMPLMGGVRELSLNSPSPSVTVHETKQVDIYDIAVLESNDADALKNWLILHNYEYPENKKHLLDYYIEKNWYFVAAKINTKALGYAGSILKEGHATPLSITFNSPTMVYPLRISGKGAENMLNTKVAAYSFESGTQSWPISRPSTAISQGPAVSVYPRVSLGEKYHGRYSLLMADDKLFTSAARSPISLTNSLEQGQSYVFSGYLKVKNHKSAQILVSVSNTTDKTMIIENPGEYSEWKRFEYPFTYRSGSQILVNVQGGSGEEIYIDALQLDEGTKTSEFTSEFLPTNKSTGTFKNDTPVNIILYVFADKKQQVPGFTTEFADHVKEKTIEKFSINEKGEPWIDSRGKKYLTKLTRTMRPSEMVDDLILRTADDQKDVNGKFAGLSWWAPLIIFIFVAGEVVVAGYFWWRYSKRKA